LFQEEVVKWLIDRGADTNSISSNGKHLVHIAATHSPLCLDLLLGNGQNVDIKDKVNGDTPLHIACNMCNSESIMVLINHGCRFNLVNNNGETPLRKLLRLQRKDFHTKTRRKLAKTLIRIGFKVYQTKDKVNPKGRTVSNGRDKAYDKYLDIVKSISEVPSLQDISREVVRESVLCGSSFKKQVHQLEIPCHLKTFLLYSV